MALQCLVWIGALLCTAQVNSMPTKCQLQRTLVETAHNLLETLTGPFPVQCLKDRAELSLPTWTLLSNTSKQDVGVAKAVYKTLMNVDSLMMNEGFPQSWNAKKLEDFQSLVFRLVEDSRCILDVKTQGEEEDFPTREAALQEYFEKLEKLLKVKKFIVCAWEVVRQELLRVLEFILVKSSSSYFTSRA